MQIHDIGIISSGTRPSRINIGTVGLITAVKLVRLFVLGTNDGTQATSWVEDALRSKDTE